MTDRESLVGALYKSRRRIVDGNGWPMIIYKSAVVDLVEKLISAADKKGLTVSRWETNSTANSFVKFITWGVHTGKRTERHQVLGDRMVAMVSLNHSEGTTERCQAYRKLKKLLGMVENWEEQMEMETL
jgi:hypothetical protein